jgi:hypothetical protein
MLAGTIAISAPILAEITIRKSQFLCFFQHIPAREIGDIYWQDLSIEKGCLT